MWVTSCSRGKAGLKRVSIHFSPFLTSNTRHALVFVAGFPSCLFGKCVQKKGHLPPAHTSRSRPPPPPPTFSPHTRTRRVRIEEKRIVRLSAMDNAHEGAAHGPSPGEAAPALCESPALFFPKKKLCGGGLQMEAQRLEGSFFFGGGGGNHGLCGEFGSFGADLRHFVWGGSPRFSSFRFPFGGLFVFWYARQPGQGTIIAIVQTFARCSKVLFASEPAWL